MKNAKVIYDLVARMEEIMLYGYCTSLVRLRSGDPDKSVTLGSATCSLNLTITCAECRNWVSTSQGICTCNQRHPLATDANWCPKDGNLCEHWMALKDDYPGMCICSNCKWFYLDSRVCSGDASKAVAVQHYEDMVRIIEDERSLNLIY